MRTVQEIYDEYRIYPRLATHMLQVGAVASIIADSLETPIDKNRIVTACLLHDMGNIVKTSFKQWPDFPESEIEKWEKIQAEFIKKYGENDHEANVKILQELGMKKEIIDLVGSIKFDAICKQAEGEDIYEKIIHYSDGRVSPYGVVSYKERMEEAQRRYGSHPDFDKDFQAKMVNCGLEIEKQIFQKCLIKPEDITAERVEPLIEELRHFVVLR